MGSVNCLLCWKTKWRKSPLGWGMELCDFSSCVWGLRSLVNTKGFWLYHVSIEWWMFYTNVRYSFAQWCRVLLFLPVIVKFLSSAFWWFVEMWWFGFYVLKLFLWGTYSFHPCIQLCSCGWALPVIDYVSFLSIWNWIFWMHKKTLDGAGAFKEQKKVHPSGNTFQTSGQLNL